MACNCNYKALVNLPLIKPLVTSYKPVIKGALLESGNKLNKSNYNHYKLIQ